MALITGKVIDLSSDGWGVVKSPDGKVTFVPGTWLEDEITFEIVSEGKFRLGRVVDWSSKSPAHRPSPCKHFGRESHQCGACPWMDINYADQLIAKEKRLSFILKNSHIVFSTRSPIFPSTEFKYRNRVKLNSDSQHLGFIAPRTHTLIPIDHCLVAEDWINDEMLALKETKLEEKEYWIQRGEADSFAQGNSKQNAIMQQSLSLLLDKEYASGVELFCGEGNFTSILSQKITTLRVYESNFEAIEKLRKLHPNVSANLKNLYGRSTLEELVQECTDAVVLFLDPPRTGYKDLSAFVGQLKNLKQIIYLSCDAMTFARDIAQLKGWQPDKLLAFDLFPQTPHLEVMGSLTRVPVT